MWFRGFNRDDRARSVRIEVKLDQILKGQGKLMADATSFQADLDALKASIEAIPARVVAAIGAAGPLTQAQLDAADAEIQAIKTEADAIAQPATPAPKP